MSQAGIDPSCADDDYERQAEIQHNGRNGVSYSHYDACALILIGKLGIYLVKSFSLVFSLAERFYHAHSRCVLLHGTHEPVEDLLAMGIDGYADFCHKVHDYRDDGQHGNEHERKHRIECHGDDDTADKQKRRANAHALHP